MSSYDYRENDETGEDRPVLPSQVILVMPAWQPPTEEATPPQPLRRRWRLPLALFVATCFSTLFAGGWVYACSIMTILICHEAGHFLQAQRYGVRASLPFFLPMPFSPIGTLGAVIAMDARIGDRKSLFDIGITGPLAGLVPTMLFSVIGLCLSTPTAARPDPSEPLLGTSFLFSALAQLMVERASDGPYINLHPMALAGWVGLLITALNLIPIGQLDGGHVLYALLRKKAHFVATLLLVLAVTAVFLGLWWWMLMVMLLMLMGPKHPPTARDDVPLGAWRIVLGWLTLAFVPLGFTPMPFVP